MQQLSGRSTVGARANHPEAHTEGDAMSMTPEYGEEELVSLREERITSRADAPLSHQFGTEAEVADLEREDRELRYLDPEANEAHAAGQICGKCKSVITAAQDARRLPDGHWVHEVCPPKPR
jgi:hypothetical protein